MAPVELRCPDCAQVLARVRRARLTVGRPFEECAKCRTLVSRPATNEWDLLGAAGKTAWIVDRMAPLFVLGLVPAGAYWALGPRDGAEGTRTLLVLLCAGPALMGGLALSLARRAIRRSRARMADPMYRARLVEFGRRAPSAARS